MGNVKWNGRYDATSTRLAILTVFVASVTSALAAPGTLTQTVSDGNETITLQLTLQSVRGPNFEILVQNASGGYDLHTPGEVRTYLGTVDEYPGAVASGYLNADDTLSSGIYFDRGATWYAQGNTVTGTRGTNPPTYNWPSDLTVQPGHAGATTFEYGVGFDLDYRVYSQAYGSDVDVAVRGVEYSTVLLQAIYLHDALLKPLVERVIVRASQPNCPYEGTTGTALLPLVATEWDSNQAAALPYNFKVGLMTTAIGGGVAYLNGRYSVSDTSTTTGLFITVWRHEIGHSFGVLDYDADSPEGPTLMCGNAYARYNGAGVRDILNHRDANPAAMTSAGTYLAVELPPYAALDVLELEWGLSCTPYPIDVVANDADVNGDALSLLDFEPTSSLGRPVTRSIGTGAGGRDELIYDPGNAAALGGFDYFHYTVADATGRPQTGLVVAKAILRRDLKAYWPLDETTGTVAGDLARSSLDGTLENGLDFATDGVLGVVGGGLTFDGVDDSIRLPALDLDSDSVTFAAWVRRDGPQPAWAGLIFTRAGSTTVGFNFGNNQELRYHWNGGEWGWDSGLVVPDATWTFVALVVEPMQATVYMHNGTAMQAVVHAVPHVAQAFSGVGFLGLDPNSGARRFKGLMDEVRVYDLALSAVEIAALHAGDVAAQSPHPRDGAVSVRPSQLTWVAFPPAVAYHVYFGLDAAAVAAADQTSPEYLGVSATPSMPSPTVLDFTTYYWRVDTELTSGLVTGPVWSFTGGDCTLGVCATNALVAATGLVGVRSGNGAAFSWVANGPAPFHHLNSVTDKLDLLDPRRSPGNGAPECDAPAPQTSCIDTDALTNAADLLFYQLLAACGNNGADEGPY